MLAVARKNKIKNMITEKRSVSVAELSKTFEVTEETIRRDLKALEKDGFLVRTYGGAYIQDDTDNQIPFQISEEKYVDSKAAIAKACLPIVQEGDSIFLDSSATSFYVCKAIQHMHLPVVTNSLVIIEHLHDCSNIRLICTGGFLSREKKAFFGKIAAQSLNSFYIDKAFFSCRSISIKQGITDSSEDIGILHQKLIERCDKVFLIADFSKFDKASFLHVCDFDNLTAIVTDKCLPNNWKDFLQKKNVKVIECSPV